ncbi:prolyl oligopeptidase family serine peptidase [Sphingomonas histidinilytica]|uniref:Oligopeptidase B Serine peptidase. MEROPS family S09A n=1 Tax=Rhizorhabdus histidinilytica TaxID=439228 RepID=A0A1T5C527_9SPHN|nr:S9 family peptidase [Rhizorhabdus histidinilytica]MBO9375383.1 prolyl oligopeptidase family serine peptidase [Rhizorhabdus histidinilytica]SKB54260.1 oligopeptidase B Serine peptidase. MEROPS family S09A [Rhizorhabdus histidinilytica]
MTHDLPAPPVAARRPHSYSRHGHRVEDPWAWLKDPKYPTVDDPDILAYLREENAYFEAAMRPHAALVETLFAEMKGRLKEDDASVPQKDGNWLYWWAYKPGGQYRLWYRKPADGADARETVILDEPAEAASVDYFRLQVLSVSPDGRLAAWSADRSGAERFELRIRDLATGQDVETVTTVANGAVAWGNDSRSLVYTEVNDNWRTYRARFHILGTDPATDRTLYEETEELGFNVGVGKTQDDRWIVVATGDNQTSEVRLVPADDPGAAPLLVSARQVKREYSVDSAHGSLWILTNDDHVNFRVARADPADPGRWETVIAGSDRVYIRGLTAFARHLVLTERVDGLDQVRLRGYEGAEHRIAFPEASYTAGLGSNPEYDPPAYRLSYASMVTPQTVFDYDPAARTLTTLKVQEIPSGYDPSLYATERLMVPARDGKAIPVSVVYRKGFPKDGSGKLFLYAYGAYGHAIPPGFSTVRLSMIDRGWAYAIAHIRGGDDLGYDWYLQGKAEQRWNTFHDFSDAARGLIAAGFTRAGNIAINGGSAGGELMGVVANTDPELWGAVVADVPFVDVLNTMQDESLPLTPGEWPEWGNPITDKAAFELIRSYSPYDNVAAKPYPPMLITGGLNDPRVTYWEPAKWAARLRATKTDDNLLLLKINMGAGHGGKSGRYESLREDAEAYAFVLTQV